MLTKFAILHILAVIFLSSVTFSNALPLVEENSLQPQAWDPEETRSGNMGDMILSAEQMALLEGTTSPQARNGYQGVERRWPYKKVYYQFNGEFSARHQEVIRLAMDKIEARTCLKFEKGTNEKGHHVEITSKTGGCFTAVGYQAKIQEMNLQVYPIGEGCFRPGSIFHELMHALGFYHEQSAADRDTYVDVVEENILEGKKFNFNIYAESDDFGVGYDYGSCLHYGPLAFSKNNRPTIVPKDTGATIGQRTDISDKDLEKINNMYKCPIKI